MIIDNILKWFNQNIAESVMAFYNQYNLFYYLIVFVILNSALIVYLNQGHTHTIKSYSISFLLILISSSILLFLATLWFKELSVLKYSSIIFAVKLSSLIPLGYFVLLEYLSLKGGASDWASNVGFSYMYLSIIAIVYYIIAVIGISILAFIINLFKGA